MVIVALAPAVAAGAEPRLAVLGDSLSAGYGLARKHAFPARLEAALRAAGCAVRVIDAAVSGDTTAGGRARLDWLLADRPDAVLVELGGNDALRGVDPATTRANLDAILGRLGSAGVVAILAGMRAPPNLGRAYGERFDALFPALAEAHRVAYYPFFLAGVAGEPERLQGDGIHPNAAGVEAIVSGILPTVRAVLAGLGACGHDRLAPAGAID